jgi:hypothetical protein
MALGIGAHVNAAAMTAFRPAVALQLPVAGTDCVGMDAKAARQLASAGKPVAGTQVAAEDGEHHLCDQLAIDGNFTARSEPESHETSGLLSTLPGSDS